MELFGPNAWLTGFYLGALKAGGEMAAHLGDTHHAKLFQEIFERGTRLGKRAPFYDYHQLIDLQNEEVLDPYLDSPAHSAEIR